MHEWGVLSTASTKFSLCEGNRVPGVTAQSRGQETLTVRYTYLQLGNPTMCVRACVHACVCAWLCDICSRQGAGAGQWLTAC